MWWVGVGLAMITSVVGHAILTRVVPRGNTVVLSVASGLAVGLALLAWTWCMFGSFSVGFVSAAVTYAAFCELYIFLFTLALGSVSANIVVRLAAGPKDAAELDSLYDSVAMVEQRLQRMQDSGMIASKTNGLRLTRRGATVVKTYRLLRRFFQHI